MTHLTLDCFDKIKIPDEERVLLPPKGTEIFVEPVEQFDWDESCFEVKFRPSQFCNQYLMIAHPEQDEDETLDGKDAE